MHGYAASDRLEIHRTVPEVHRQAAAQLYWQAFEKELLPGLGPAAQGAAFLARHLALDRMLAAIQGGRLLGIVGFHDQGRSAVNIGLTGMAGEYGWLATPWRMFMLGLLEQTCLPGQLQLDGIAVDGAQRGRGIGSRLLVETRALARERGCSRVRLSVVDSNPRAKALYLRLGFMAEPAQSVGLLRPLLGFGALTAMSQTV